MPDTSLHDSDDGVQGRQDIGRWRGRRSIFSRIWELLAPVRRVVFPGMFVCFLALLALFVWYLLYAPKRTPLLIVQAAPYVWPFPPNAWAEEDLQDLALLDRETVSISGLTRTAKSRQDVLGMIADAARADSTRREPVIVYVSMHGVAYQGTPYLVPPAPSDASAYQPSTWLKLEDLIEEIDESFPDRNKLLVLDSSRIDVNWHAGLLANNFSQELINWWTDDRDADGLRDFAILSSAGDGEQAWSSSVLQGSVFGHFFRMGLAGDADGFAAVSSRDRHVTLSELHKYLESRVSTWARYNRKASQVPMLLSDGADFDLARTLRPRVVAEHRAQAAKMTAASGATAENSSLWESLEQLRLLGLYRFEPLAWRDLEHKLLWLEQLSASGEAYNDLEVRTREELQTQFQAIQERVSRARSGGSLQACCTVLSGDSWSFPDQLRMRSLAVGEFFDTIDPETASKIRDQLVVFQNSPDDKKLATALRRLDRLAAHGMVERQFLYMLARYQSPGLWDQAGRLRDLLRIRERADELSVPGATDDFVGDERAHYWVRAELDSADARRRDTEDRLIVDGQPEFDPMLAAAHDAYRSAARVKDDVSTALELRDRAWAELGYLAQWLAHPYSQADHGVIEAANDARGLANAISDHRLLSGDDLEEIGDNANNVVGTYQSLRTDFDMEIERLADPVLLDDTDDTETLRRIEAVLTTPLLATQQRAALRLRHAELARKLNRTYMEGNYKVQEDAGDPGPRRWDQHPLFALLGIDNIARSDWNDEWRSHLAGLLLFSPNKATERGTWSIAEHRLRSVAPIWFPRPAADPVRQLRQIDLHALLLWHARRSMADFWGPAGDAQPFFDAAASDYLESATRFLDGRVSTAAANLATQLNAKRLAVHNWLTTSADDDVLLESSDAKTTVRIRSATESPDRPAGTAALLLRHRGERLGGLRFEPMGGVQLPLESREIDMTAPIGALPQNRAGLDLDVETVFRGHEFPGLFRVEQLGGVVIEHEPTEYGPGRVVLHSPWKELAVVVVLDCSESMEGALQEGSDGELTVSRLSVAKQALQQLLSQLGSRRGVRVGVRFFGHRLGWSTDRPVRVMTSPSYPFEIPTGISPDSDVERVLPLSNFDFAAAQSVFAALEGVQQGWGQSPLYLCLDQVLEEDFAAQEPDTEKHVIVITDGRNYQFRPDSAAYRGLNDVVARGQQQEVRIHILGLAMDQDEERSATADFSRIADETGGIFRSLDSSPQLRDTLESIVRRDEYRLEQPSGQTAGPTELGRPLTGDEGNNWYTLQFEELEELVRLEGDEFIDFFFEPQDRILQVTAYDHDLADLALSAGAAMRQKAEGELTSGDGGLLTNHWMRVHRPVRDEQGVVFPISVQRYQNLAGGRLIWQWTERPQEVWVEITPLVEGSQAGPTYIFYDTNYEPDKRTPVLHLLARAWPDAAKQAEIQFWFRPNSSGPPSPIDVVSLSEATATDRPDNRGFVERVVGGVKLRVDGMRVGTAYRVRVVEDHRGAASRVGSFKVYSPQTGEIQPSTMIRQYDSRHNMAVHSFYYDDADQDVVEALRNAEIGLARREVVQADCMVAEPLRIEISDAGNFLPLSSK